MKKIIVIFLIISSHIILFAQDDVVIGRYKKIDSKILGGKVTFLEHLPSGYDKSSSYYPVLFIMNAQILSTFENAASIVDRLSQERIPQMILIGISNSGVGEKFWACPGDSGKVDMADMFNDFLERELLPYIKKNYRTNNYRIFFGQSNAGLFTLYSFLNKPNLFNAYIIASPMFGWCPDFYLNKTINIFQSNRIMNNKLYIAYGDLDYKEAIIDRIGNFEQILKEQSPKGLKWKIDLIKNEGHVPYTTLNDALLFFFSGCTITDEMRKGNLQDLKLHFTKISEECGFEVYPEEEALFDMGMKRKMIKKYDESIEIFKYLIGIFPNSAKSYFYLAETFREKGDLELAIINYHKTLNITPDFQQAVECLKLLENKK